MVRKLIAVLMVSFVGLLASGAVGASWEPLDKRGCCSHHSGVCGCESGSAKCCDGQLSPTCGC